MENSLIRQGRADSLTAKRSLCFSQLCKVFQTLMTLLANTQLIKIRLMCLYNDWCRSVHGSIRQDVSERKHTLFNRTGYQATARSWEMKSQQGTSHCNHWSNLSAGSLRGSGCKIRTSRLISPLFYFHVEDVRTWLWRSDGHSCKW